MAASLKDPRVYVSVGDGVEYMKENKGNFDVIITDAPDPIGRNRSKVIKLFSCLTQPCRKFNCS